MKESPNQNKQVIVLPFQFRSGSWRLHTVRDFRLDDLSALSWCQRAKQKRYNKRAKITLALKFQNHGNGIERELGSRKPNKTREMILKVK